VTAFVATCVYGQILTIWQPAFARDFALVEAQKPFLEFLILVSVGDVHGAHAAVQSTWGYKIGIDTHVFHSLSSLPPANLKYFLPKAGKNKNNLPD
jgi:hypothetical protein